MGALPRRWILRAVAVVAAAALLWQWLSPSCTYNYRLTIDVETPDGIKSGSSVIQRKHIGQRFVPGFSGRGLVRITGEAVYVDLGQGKNLFVTLTDDASGRLGDGARYNGALDAGTLPWQALGLKFGILDEWTECRAARNLLGRPAVNVPPMNLPTTVTFRDLSQPKSVELVDPRFLASTFGKGYALTAAKIEITNDPPTTGIERILPWLNQFKQRGALDGTQFPGPADPLASQLGYLTFKNYGL
jgi:hypothetical protein